MRDGRTVLLVLLACSCAAGPPWGYPRPERPRGGVLRSDGGHAIVLYAQPEELPAAQQVARVVDDHFDRAAAAIGERREAPAEVWLDPRWHVRGTTFERCIVFRSDAETLPFADLLLTHELVHWHAEGTVLQESLPHVVLEGLCEYVAAELVARWSEDRRALHRGSLQAARERGDLPRLVGLMEVDADGWVALPGPDRLALYGLGFVLVERIGVETLRDAAREGALSSGDVLALAGVGPDGSGL